MKYLTSYSYPIAAILFGIITLVEGGNTIKSVPTATMLSQSIVPVVLYFNFTSGFLYIAIGIWALKSRFASRYGATTLALLIFVVGVYLTVHILSGATYMPRTVGALALRFIFWSGFIFWAQKNKTGQR
ncbi:MAG TPA: hypothetical protein PLY93_03540 [Turneriella sp.]|nr:hypothetical protein [Turneriella sp.]